MSLFFFGKVFTQVKLQYDQFLKCARLRNNKIKTQLKLHFLDLKLGSGMGGGGGSERRGGMGGGGRSIL